MKKKEIIKDSNEFSSIIKNSKYIKAKYFTIYYKDTNFDGPLFGITISKKAGHAVIRNKLKRRTKSIIDANKLLFKNNEKYIIIIKATAVNINYNDLELDLITAVKER